MGTVKAYLTNNWTVVLSLGQAKDKGRDYRVVSLHYEGDLKELVNANDVVWYVSDTISGPWFEESVFQHFYFSREEAIEAAKKAGLEDAGVWNCHDIIIEDDHDYKPVELPMQTPLMRNEKGFYCRLNLHPEEDGWRSKGKIFFPDRDCADKLCEGPVIVQSVKDKGSYGFFTGRMVQYKAPSDEQVAEYVIQNNLYDKKIRFMEGKFGTYVNIPGLDASHYSDCLSLGPDGSSAWLNATLTDYGEKASVCVEEISGVDLVCQGYQGCSFDEFYGRFVKFGFDGYGAVRSIRFISKLFDEASDFVSLKTIQNVDFVEVDREQMMYALDQFSREEMAEIIAKVAEINNRANDAVKAKVKSGKMRLC